MVLKGKKVFVTGSNRGIGKCIVERMASEGADVYAHARKKNEKFELFLSEVAQENKVNVSPVYFDLTKEEEVSARIKDFFSDRKRVDILVNNAGVPYGGLLTMTPISKIREVYEVNVFAQIQITQLVARQMMRQKSGCIINMCSVGGIETCPGYLAYGSSKAAMIWITKSISKELGRYGIRVNGIAPGLVDTDMGNFKSDEELNKVLDRMTIHRMGQPEEIANAAVYLASEAASYMTGQILVLDGGRV